ncbi:hypothetical protein DB346_23195 [Verrucomicrobia bacterium LW23]|nr:hypothetical protein DB346_23195 [Verrucomicrobia bacterium LW23]
MKYNILLSAFAAFVMLAVPARAQMSVAIVADPMADLRHIQDLAQWSESIARLNQQIQQMQQYIELATTMKNVVGDPASAIDLIGLDGLGTGDLTRSIGQLTGEITNLADGAMALADSGQGLFSPIEFKTPGGFDMEFDTSMFRRFGAVQQHGVNLNAVIDDTSRRMERLKQEKATTLSQIKMATDQSSVQKLSAKINALDGEIAALGHQQTTASQQLMAQEIANRNDMERQQLAASQAADKELTLSITNYSRWQGRITAGRQPFR